MRKSNTVCCELTVLVRDARGGVIATRRRRRDLLVRNMVRFAIGAHTFWVNNSVSVTDEGGVARTAFVNNDINARKIAIGTGTTAPAYTDYKLEAKTAETTAVTVTEISNGYAAAASIYLAGGGTISEAGYFINVAGTYWMMMMRDTFASVDVPAGGTISITFKVTT